MSNKKLRSEKLTARFEHLFLGFVFDILFDQRPAFDQRSKQRVVALFVFLFNSSLALKCCETFAISRHEVVNAFSLVLVVVLRKIRPGVRLVETQLLRQRMRRRPVHGVPHRVVLVRWVVVICVRGAAVTTYGFLLRLNKFCFNPPFTPWTLTFFFFLIRQRVLWSKFNRKILCFSFFL